MRKIFLIRIPEDIKFAKLGILYKFYLAYCLKKLIILIDNNRQLSKTFIAAYNMNYVDNNKISIFKCPFKRKYLYEYKDPLF